jgi:hypothetical protein
MPLNIESVSYCDPDTSSALPIAFEIVDPHGDVARKTLDSLEVLWNQGWNSGGYGRYHVTSEPDSPGAWPFSSLFVARAYCEAENYDKVWRVLRWLNNLQGGNGGAWFEFYGNRPTPPLPPVGIVVWTWAEIVMLLLHHIVGVRPRPGTITVRPRLLSGLNDINADLLVHGSRLQIRVIRDAQKQFALVDGKRKDLVNGSLKLPPLHGDTTVEIHIA